MRWTVGYMSGEEGQGRPVGDRDKAMKVSKVSSESSKIAKKTVRGRNVQKGRGGVEDQETPGSERYWNLQRLTC